MSELLYKNKNLILIIITNIINLAINGSFWLLGAFFLTKEIYGQITLILSISFLTSSLAVFGFGYGILIFGSQDNYEYWTPTYNVTILFLSILFGSIIGIIQNHWWEYTIIVIGHSIYAINPIDQLAQKKYKKFSLWLITCGGLRLLLSVIGILNYFDPLFIIILYSLPPLLIGITFYHNVGKGLKNYRISNIKKKSKNIIVLGGIALQRNLFSYLDKIIIAFWLGSIILGEYQFVFQIFLILQFIPAAIQNYLISEKVDSLIKSNTFKLSIILSITLIILIILFAKPLINWVFPKYSNVTNAIYIISFTIPFSSIASIYISTLMVNKFHFSLFISYILSLIFQYSAMLILVPLIKIEGIALSLLVNQISLFILCYIGYKYQSNKQNESI